MKLLRCVSQKFPDDIVAIIQNYLDRDEIYNFPKTYSKQLINHILKNRINFDNTCYSLPSYYDMIRNYQLSKIMILKWKRKTSKDYPRVQIFKTRYKNVYIICSLYDTFCINENQEAYTERTVRLEINGDVSKIQILLNQDITFEKTENKLWIWKRVDFIPELYQNYIERYYSYTRIQMLKEMETILLNIDF